MKGNQPNQTSTWQRGKLTLEKRTLMNSMAQFSSLPYNNSHTAFFTIPIYEVDLLAHAHFKQQKLKFQRPWLYADLAAFIYHLFLTTKMFPHMCVYVRLHYEPHVFRVLPQQPVPFSGVVTSSLENFLACQRSSFSAKR